MIADDETVPERPVDFPSLATMELARMQRDRDAPTGDSLRTRLLGTAGRLVGAAERDDFLRRLGRARGYRLSPRTAKVISDSLKRDAEGLEQNVDLIRLPPEGLWFEFAESDLAREPATDPIEGRRKPLNVGILVTPDPEEEDRFVVMSAWDFEPHFGVRRDGLIRHGYGVIAFSMAALADHAFLARHRRLDENKPTHVRLLDLSIGYVPPGFRDEALVTGDVDPNDEFSVKRLIASLLCDVAAEIPLALALTLLLSAPGSTFANDSGEEGIEVLEVRETPGRRLLGRVLGTGFRRRGSANSPSVRFIPLRA